MVIGRWSDERSCIALQEDLRAKSGVTREMSGDVWWVLWLVFEWVCECC